MFRADNNLYFSKFKKLPFFWVYSCNFFFFCGFMQVEVWYKVLEKRNFLPESSNLSTFTSIYRAHMRTEGYKIKKHISFASHRIRIYKIKQKHEFSTRFRFFFSAISCRSQVNTIFTETTFSVDGDCQNNIGLSVPTMVNVYRSIRLAIPNM